MNPDPEPRPRCHCIRNRALLLWVVATAAIVGWTFDQAIAADAQRTDASAIQQAMQGTWIVSMAERGGEASERDIGQELKIVGDKIYDQSGKLTATFEIDASHAPAQIDFLAPTQSGQARLFGILEVDKTVGKTTLRTNYGGQRPTSFQDGGLYFDEFVRKAEQEKP